MSDTRIVRHFPMFFDLQGRCVLVLGAGPAAERKAAAVTRCGAVVRRAAGFAPALLDGCALAIGAEAPEAELRALSAAALARGVPVNVVDRPELCSFITPAVIDRDPVTIAIGSGGVAPVLARLLRARIEAVVPPAYAALAALAGRFSAEARRMLPDVGARRLALERALTGPARDLVLAGREAEAEAVFAATLAEGAAARPAGVVFLVGAGPGAADLLTLRALRVLGEADVIVHDRLVSAAVLDLARRDAERIYVGKARGRACLPQAEINALLIRLARQGQRVVRLKGGDPFVFGRGGEEAEAARAAGLAVEVVPGVTAALACAAWAGIPLTHREVARCLTLVTGHTSAGRLEVDFAALARIGGTLAVYMGAATLGALAEGLVGAGMAAATPAALIENGGGVGQRTLYATLGTLAARAAGWGSGGPALILVGAAVGRGDQQIGSGDLAGNLDGGADVAP